MNTKQSGTKRDSSHITFVQDHGMLTRSKARENKRRKLEEYEDVEMEEQNVNSLQLEGSTSNLPQKRDNDANTENLNSQDVALNTENIVENIISFLDVDSIKNARQLNPLWSAEGAKMLIKRCFISIPRGLRTGKFQRKVKLLNKFKAFLSHKSSEVSMIPKIAINTATDAKLWKKLGVLGPQVKSLKVDCTIGKRTGWLKYLLDRLPNLKYLSLSEGIYKKETLKVLSSEKDRTLFIPSLVQLPFTSVEMLEAIDKFSDCSNIKLEELLIMSHTATPIPQLDLRVPNIVSKLLSSNQSTLKQLILIRCEFYLSLLKFPILPVFTFMELHFYFGDPDQTANFTFPPSFRFSESMPNLKAVTIENVGYEEDLTYRDFFVRVFDQCGPAPSVKRLKLTNNTMDFDLDPLFRVFPNVQVFKAENLTKSMFQTVWKKGANLKKLSLDNIDLDDVVEDVADFDSIFTGFSPDTVNMIKKSKKVPGYSVSKLEKLRVNPSILDLKQLEYLKIHFNGNCQKMPKRMLAVSGEYAFRRMSKSVKIQIQCEDDATGLAWARKSLDEVSKITNVTVNFVAKTDSFIAVNID